jgi:transcriptional regulator with XRE-family HTH domain
MSQLALALEADISAKHVSFLESGRATPSREMVLLLAEQLEIPLRDRNLLLLAAGYAPCFPERSLDDPALEGARRALDLVLRGHEPYPAIAIDRYWTLVAANGAFAPIVAGVDSALLAPPLNVLRLSLHPLGLASRIVNLAEWRAHLFARLRRQIAVSGDSTLQRLLEELRGYPSAADKCAPPGDHVEVAVALRLRAGEEVLSFISTTTVFGTPVEVTLSELAIESFFPADAATAAALRQALPAPISCAEARDSIPGGTP